MPTGIVANIHTNTTIDASPISEQALEIPPHYLARDEYKNAWVPVEPDLWYAVARITRRTASHPAGATNSKTSSSSTAPPHFLSFVTVTNLSPRASGHVYEQNPVTNLSQNSTNSIRCLKEKNPTLNLQVACDLRLIAQHRTTYCQDITGAGSRRRLVSHILVSCFTVFPHV